MLEDFPQLGHPGSVDGTRELLVRGLPYLVVYALTSADYIDIVAIVHARRNYP
jgi:toxin ParE1/3/4